MNHSEMDELYELYSMGVLDSAEAAEISDHVARQCEYCLARIRESGAVLESLASMVEPVAPPAGLRNKVLAIPGLNRSKVRFGTSRWTIGFALAAAATLALFFWDVTERTRLHNVRHQLEEVTRQRNELRSAVAVLSQSDVRTVEFGHAGETHGRVFISGNGGVVFVGTRLPKLASGKTFELWLVPGKGHPQAAGLFRSNAEGISVNVLKKPVHPGAFAAVAVSIEPDGGSPQPSSKPILVVPLA